MKCFNTTVSKVVLSSLLILAFASSHVMAAKQKASKKADAKQEVTVVEPKSNSSYKGAGLRITVPAPSFSGGSEADSWIPQVIQDLMTTGFHDYSKMTVIDRQNEDLILAEQRRSENSRYSDEDYLELGRITQAQYILAGNIINANGMYRISLRINDGSTNESKATFSGNFNVVDIQNGNATNAALLKLLQDMDFTLTSEEKAILSKKVNVQQESVLSTVNLAKGMAAEHNKNTVEAMAYYIDAKSKEADLRYANLSAAVVTGNIREDAKNEIALRNAWKKNIEDLAAFLKTNMFTVKYDTEPGKYTVTDWDKGLASIPFSVTYEYNPTAAKVYAEFRSGLKAAQANYNSDWKLKMPSTSDTYYCYFSLKDEKGNVLSTAENRFNNTYFSTFASKFEVTVSVATQKGNDKNVGKSPFYNQDFFQYGNKIIQRSSKSNDDDRYIREKGTVTFKNVKVDNVSDSLNFSLDGVSTSYYRNSEPLFMVSFIPVNVAPAKSAVAAVPQGECRVIVPGEPVTDKKYKVGDIGPGGGIVFWTGTKKIGKQTYHYMEASPSMLRLSNEQKDFFANHKRDLSQNFWSGGVENIHGVKIKSDIGNGLTFTNALYAYINFTKEDDLFSNITGYSYGGYSDWFLMGEDEICELARTLNETPAARSITGVCVLSAFGGARMFSTSQVGGTNYIYKGWSFAISPHDLYYADAALYVRFF